MSSAAISRDESMASLRLLVHMARADGVLHGKERQVLESSLAEADVDDGTDMQSLLDAPGELDAVLCALRSPAAREHAYDAVFAMAYTDGECAPSESALLERIRATLRIEDEHHRSLERLFEHKPGAGFVPKADPAPAFAGLERQAKAQSETRKTAIVCALLGAFPVPGLAIATDLAIVGLQVALARDIGRYWGQEMDRDQAKGILAGFGVGTGARIAVSNLLKFFPGWGAAFGAASAYASTYAVGRVMQTYFEEGRGVDADTLQKAFEAAKAEGREAYEKDKQTIASHEREHRDELQALNTALKAGQITQAEFETEAARL